MSEAHAVSVLLVDDMPANLLALSEALDGLGLNLVTADSGLEALRCVLQQDFAAILLDVRMPGMDGLEVAQRIRQRASSRNTPVIFLTGQDLDAQTMAKAYAVGAVDYLVKPLVPEFVRAKVRVFMHLAQARQALEQEVKVRRETEAALVEAKAIAEHANAAKDTFLATMSHEIRTPMNGLMGMLELLDLSPLDREQKETLTIARDSGHAVGRIIDDILDHAKIVAGKFDIRPEPMAFAELLPRVVNTYFALASTKGLTLRQMVDPRISPAVMADPLRLLQVVGNFVSNAIKFTQEGTIEVRSDLVRRAAGTETIRISVRDTGIGMNADALSRLFQPFEQASVDTQRLYGGTGLGLAISQRLTQMMGGGAIVVESAEGTGTCMSVEFTFAISDTSPALKSLKPANDAYIGRVVADAHADARADAQAGAESADPMRLVSADGTRRANVLAVDDNPTNRLLLRRQLRMLGAQVQTAADGHEALSLWRSGEFDLVITDCNMAETDGYALARAIRNYEAAHGRTRIPILAWTASVGEAFSARCREAGMDDMLTKPTDLAMLKAALGKALRSRDAPPARQALAPAGFGAAADTDTPTSPVAPDMGGSALAAKAASVVPTIDLTLLKEATDGDGTLLRELIAVAHCQIETECSTLLRALDSGEMATAVGLSHSLKGSSGSVGARALAELSAQLEEAAGGNDAQGAVALRAQLAAETAKVLAALDAA